MFAWLAANGATIIISALLIVVVGLIVRGMLKGRIKTCGDCGSCGGCAAGDTDTGAGCAACRFHDRCGSGSAGP